MKPIGQIGFSLLLLLKHVFMWIYYFHYRNPVSHYIFIL